MTIKDIASVNKALVREFLAHPSPVIELIEAQTHDSFFADKRRVYGRRGEEIDGGIFNW